MNEKVPEKVPPATIKTETGYKGRRSNQKGSVYTKNSSFVIKRFVGTTSGLEGVVYDVGTSTHSELFTITTEKIAAYAGRTCKEAQDIRVAIEKVEDIKIPKPVKDTEGDDAINEKILNRDIEAYVKRKAIYRQNKSSLYSVVMGQCTDAMKAKLKGISAYSTTDENSDVIELLKLIRQSTFDFQSNQYPFLAIHTSLKLFFGQFQGYHQPVSEYMDVFMSNKNMLEHCGAQIGNHPDLQTYLLIESNIDPVTATNDQKLLATNNAIEVYCAIAFLCGLNRNRYQDLLDELINSYLNGRDEYPRTLVLAYKLVTE